MKKKELAERLAAIEKHLGIEPKKNSLELDKWYKNNSGEVGTLLFLENANNSFFSGYGFCEGDWIGKEDAEGYSGWTTKNWTLATPEEVKSALVEEAKSRGYKQGDKVSVLWGKLSNWGLENDYSIEVTKEFAVKVCGIYVFSKGKWAEIIEQPKSILDGKVAIRVDNEREFELLMKHYEENGWMSCELSLRHNGFGSTHHIIEYKDDFLRIDESNIIATSQYTIIPFSEFAAEVGIEVPVFIMKSEDGVDLYEGDNYFHVWITGMKWEVLLNSQNKKGSFKFNVDGKFPETDKAFSTREAAEKWIEQANKPEEIVGYKLSNGKTANITHKSIRVFNGNDWFNISPSDVEDLHHALKQLKGGDNA